MKWFDTKEIRDEASLATEQIAYLKRPSLTIYGPFNVIVRRHWDLLVTSIVLSIALQLVLHYGLGTTDSDNWNSIADFVAQLCLAYFAISHGRRLAWNRNHWDSFEAFQESERKWKPWAILVVALLLAEVAYSALFIAGVF